MKVLNDYLGHLVRSQLDNTKPDKIPEGVCFEQIADVARRNHLTFMLFNALLKTGSLNQSQIDICQKFILQDIIISTTQKRELAQWKKECELRGIVNQPLKGAIMKGLYPNAEMRQMSDLDILIGKDSMDKTKELLSDMGYSLVQAIRHHDIYAKQGFMVVEAHRDLYDKHVDKGQYQYFSDFSRAKLVKGCQYTYEFSKEDFYVYMLAHAAKHFYAMGCGIRNLIDVYVYRKTFQGQLDQDYLDQELKKCGILAFSRNMETLAFYWLDNQRPGNSKEEFYEDLFQYMSDSGIYGKDANGIWNKFSQENAGKADAKQLKKWYYFPPVTYMAQYYSWLEEHPKLLPFAWFIRLCRGLFLHKGAKKRQMVDSIEDKDIDKYRRIYYEMQLKFKA